MVSAHGAHLHQQATEDLTCRTAEAALPNFSIPDRKADLRRRAMAARHAAAPDRARHAADRFLEALGAEIAGRRVAGYWPMAGEIDPRPLLERLHAMGVALALPVIEGSSLSFRAWHPGLAVRPGARGTSHPEAGDFVIPAVVIAPLVAFDGAGHRLGRGAGFYDRTIARLRAEGSPLVVGLAYDVQEHDDVPVEPGDQRLDWIVTETRAIKFPSPLVGEGQGGG